MKQAWRRYRYEPDILVGLVIELRDEIMRNHELADWARREIADITAHLQEMEWIS